MITSVSGLVVFPIKSFDGIAVDQVRLLRSGAIAGDRRFAVIDEEGRFVNAKRTAVIQRIRAEFAGWSVEGRFATVTLSGPEIETTRFSGDGWQAEMGTFLTETLGSTVRIVEDVSTGFPDDLDSPGPTLVTTATLAAVSAWFGLTLEETARRFRTNVVISADEAFTEDRWLGPEGAVQIVRIGDVPLIAVNPCQRCVVPTRDSRTGDVLTGFQKAFAERRESSLPEGVVRKRFTHYYRLAINTRPVAGFAGGVVALGDELCSVSWNSGL